MGKLDDFTDSELRQELHQREQARQAAEWARLNEHYGPCPQCGANLREVSQNVVQEHFDAPGWSAWPVPPPPDWHGKRRVAAEWETKVVCTNGHERYERDVKFDEVAAAREP